MRTKIPKEKYLMNFPKMGNVSAASIPTVLAEYYNNGTIKKGDVILTPAVGGGFYWGGGWELGMIMMLFLLISLGVAWLIDYYELH